MDSTSKAEMIKSMAPSNAIEYFIICITLVIGFWIWTNRSSKDKQPKIEAKDDLSWDGKKERREHVCTEVQAIYKAKERISILETKEQAKDVDMQEFKRTVEKQFLKMDTTITDGFNKIDMALIRIHEKIESIN